MSNFQNHNNNNTNPNMPTMFGIPGLTRMNSLPAQNNVQSLDQGTVVRELLSKSHHFMRLKIFVDGPNDLHKAYVNSVADHNARVLSQPFVDSGFDLFTPTNALCSSTSVNKIDFKIKCSAQMVYDLDQMQFNTGFYMYPRSSLSKLPIRLANSVGIIDAGYRGNVMGMFDCMPCPNEYSVLQYDRIVQICAPGLVPIYVEMVDNTDDLGETQRNTGGFGSTGR
jgi:dUTP pyrophosphatase